MFIHNKDLQFEVRASQPDPRFATILQEQFGGANGELKAAILIRPTGAITPHWRCWPALWAPSQGL